MFDERDMIGIEYASGGGVPKAVGFCVWGIANENARGGSLEDFRIVGLNEGERPASNFAEM